jgi:hypothetical protein
MHMHPGEHWCLIRISDDNDTKQARNAYAPEFMIVFIIEET